MERRDRPAVATFFTAELPVAARTVQLDDRESHHVHVRRVGAGERVRLVDGGGTVGWGTTIRVAKALVTVEVESVESVEPPPATHLLIPVADRDRMLWLAEKAVELGATSWRPVLWRRSRSVSPRGEGVTFQAKVRARMIAALTQSGGAWLPTMYPDADLDRAIAATPTGQRFLLDADGDCLSPAPNGEPLSLAVGPEGGIEPAERDEMLAAGWRLWRIAHLTLRFETAALAGLALARASSLTKRENAHDA